jgi:pyruvate/2-oxoglutarate dehydrogenase complex dihydrolipoamide acyltransferase (E2) component
MSRVPITIPADGWGGAPVQLQLWLVEIGDDVDTGDTLAELSIPGVIGDLAAPVTGRVIELQATSDRWWNAGDVVGWIETAEATA